MRFNATSVKGFLELAKSSMKHEVVVLSSPDVDLHTVEMACLYDVIFAISCSQ